MIPLSTITLKVNGRNYTVEVKPSDSLLEVLRDKLHITSPKIGCNTGDCGACSVLLDGKLAKSCVTNAMIAEGKEVTTVEGLAKPGELHPLQEAFYEHNAAQCGYCTPGMIVAAKALLDENPNPKREEVRKALSGNFCRCTGYAAIVDAVMDTAKKMTKKRR